MLFFSRNIFEIYTLIRLRICYTFKIRFTPINYCLYSTYIMYRSCLIFMPRLLPPASAPAARFYSYLQQVGTYVSLLPYYYVRGNFFHLYWTVRSTCTILVVVQYIASKQLLLYDVVVSTPTGSTVL